MLKRSSLFIFALMILPLVNMVLPYSVAAANIPGTNIPTTVTRVMIANVTASPITIGVTVQAVSGVTQDGCGVSIVNLDLVDSVGTLFPLTVNPGNPFQGTVAIPAMTTYELVSLLTNPFAPLATASQNCLQGLTVTFGAYQQCPGGGAPFPVPSSVPNGVNQYEPTLNLPGTIANAPVGGNETMDLTCVNGANSLLQIAINAPVAPNLWRYDSTKTIPSGGSLTSGNSWVNVAGKCDDNCSITVGGVTTDRPFVYPFGCSQCNIFHDPNPPCPAANGGQFCAAQNGLPPNMGCTIDRSPGAGIETQQFGGTIVVSYLGPAIPPANCGIAPPPPGKHSGLPPRFCKPVPKPTLKQIQEYYAFKFRLLQELKGHPFPPNYKPINLCPGMM